MPALTATKRKAILREPLGVGELPWADVVAMASRHQVRPQEVHELLAAQGCRIAAPPPSAPSERRPNPDRIPPEVLRGLLKGIGYQMLMEGEAPEDTWVLTRLSRWRRERAVIARLIAHYERTTR